jgi:hypothetical protein
VEVKLVVEKSFDWLRAATVTFVAVGLALPIYSVAMLVIDNRSQPPLLPDIGWAIIFAGAYILAAIPAAVLTCLGRSRRIAFALSLLCVLIPPSLLLAMFVVAASMGGE